MKTRNQLLHSSSSRKAGFSLAELMVVIVILGLLATVVVPNVMGRLAQAEHQVAATTITGFADAAKAYKIQNRRWPETLEELTEEDQNGHRYLEQSSIPMDPWGNPYFYEPPAVGSTPTIISYGEGGEAGGEGSQRDVSYEMILGGEN
jgi:general secretion pathway protein G